MSHYTDIGFKVNSNKEVVDLFNQIFSNKKFSPVFWNIPSTKEECNVLAMQKLGEIRYFSKLNRNKEIIKIGLAHNNEYITKMGIVDINYNKKYGFPILQLEKDDILFWFECPNVEIFDMKNEKDCNIKISSFANYVKIKNPKENTEIDETSCFADESYISNWNDNPSIAFISGIIKNYKLEKML